ncbi:MAG TPA: arylesterase, partial [Burkholderiales bacterium]|nr:arylesterase [Burkholderiales bacterium]
MKSILFAVLLAGGSAALAAPTILVYGDSLSSAYGIPQSAGWVALLGERLKQRKSNYTVANASISGETSAGGAARIEGTLARTKPAIVVVELGANDGLRGLPIVRMKANLASIVQAAKRQGARVIIVGMQLPPNYGV